MLVSGSITNDRWHVLDPDGALWHRATLNDEYDLVYRMASGAPAGAQPLAIFNLRRWLHSEPKGRIVRAQWWPGRLELAALDGTKIKAHTVVRASQAEEVAYHTLLMFEQLDWSGASVPLFWEGDAQDDVRTWTKNFVAHWHERSLDGILRQVN